MYRLLLLSLLLPILAACAAGPGRGVQAQVVGESQYCGTASQDSSVRYFPDADAFGNWIDYRNTHDFNAGMAQGNGVVVVEMGQRPTGGYNIRLDNNETTIEDNTLTLGMTWNAPRLDAAVSQALIASCVAIRPPQGEYDTIRVVDQLGDLRGQARVKR